MVVILILSPNCSCVINNDVMPGVHGARTTVSIISSCSSQIDPDNTYATTKEGEYNQCCPITIKQNMHTNKRGQTYFWFQVDYGLVQILSYG